MKTGNFAILKKVPYNEALTFTDNGVEAMEAIPGWTLFYMGKEAYEAQGKGITWSVKVEDGKNIPYMDPESCELSVEKIALFLQNPTPLHFFGLLLGWSIYSTTADEHDWINLEENCHYGDTENIICHALFKRAGKYACTCGSPGMVASAISDLLRAHPNHPDVDSEEERKEYKAKTLLIEGNDSNQGAWHFMAYALDAVDFTEHGSSVYGAWLTDKGFWYAFLCEAWINDPSGEKETTDV